MRVAVTGLGFGELHVRSLLKIENVESIVICDKDENRLREISHKYSIEKWSTSYEEILSDDTIEVVTLAVPHHLHRPMVEKALQSNKHVYCEKPLTIKFSDAEELVRMAEERHLALTVGFNMRYYKQYQRAFSMIDAGLIGRVFLVECFARADARGLQGFRLKKEEAGGGCLIDSGAHRFDLIRWLFGPVESVYTRAGTYVVDKMEGEDTALVSMRFQSGAIGSLTCSWGTYVPPWDEGMRIYGTRGSIFIWDHDLSFCFRNCAGEEEIQKYRVSYEDSIALSLKDFLEQVEKGNLEVDRVKTLAHLQLIEASYESWEKSLPVEINNSI